MFKYVLTGGNGVGKTSLILALQLAGYEIIRESASDFLYVERAKGNLFPLDSSGAEEIILNIQIRRELNIDPSRDRVFLDRCIHDHFVYANILKQDISTKAIDQSKNFSYDIIFFIELSFEYGIGNCTQREVKYSEKLAYELELYYKKLGITIIKIPPGSIESRLNKILLEVKKYEEYNK